jgi:hypothetical protein
MSAPGSLASRSMCSTRKSSSTWSSRQSRACWRIPSGIWRMPRELVKSWWPTPRPKRAGRTERILRLLLRRLWPLPEAHAGRPRASGQPFGRAEVDQVIRFLLLALKRYGIVEQVRERRRFPATRSTLMPCAGCRAGRDSPRGPDAPAGSRRDPARGQPLLRRVLPKLRRPEVRARSREHTAQVASEDREEREDRFPQGDLPLLFCSPDHGAGRGHRPAEPGQPAQRAAHAGQLRPAQRPRRPRRPTGAGLHLLRRPQPARPVLLPRAEPDGAGSVAPPRIDLRNRDLVRSHVHAVWMEVAKPDLGKT